MVGALFNHWLVPEQLLYFVFSCHADIRQVYHMSIHPAPIYCGQICGSVAGTDEEMHEFHIIYLVGLEL